MTRDEFRAYALPLCHSARRFNKVFGIGANKTGTTTLGEVLHLIGLNVAPQALTELNSLGIHHGELNDLVSFMRAYDAFQDRPFSMKSYYAQMDALFPKSKFILTYRDPEQWFASRCNFAKRNYGVDDVAKITESALKERTHVKPGYMYRMNEIDWFVDVDAQLQLTRSFARMFDQKYCIAQYQQRNQEIIRHFSERPQDLLVIDLTTESDTHKIINFLGLPTGLVTAMPHANKT
jgi:hypothetical protein